MESLREPKKQDIEVPNITISTNETLSLNGSSYTENQKDEYFWDMGDSSQYDTQLINHSYNSPGEYAVELLALSKGSSDSSRYVFNVTATREIVLKEFSIPGAIQPNTTLRLDATEFVDTDLADTTWIIDDEIFTNSTVEYTFREEKRYDVELVVERTDRECEILSQSVIVDKALGSGL